MSKTEIVQFLQGLHSTNLPPGFESFVDENFTPKALGAQIFKAPTSVLPPLSVTYDVRRGVWILLNDYTVPLNGYTITAHAQFEFDLASIPRVFWWAIAPNELSLVAPLIHDLLYRYSGRLPQPGFVAPFREFDRKQADEVFLNLMEQEGVSVWRRVVAYRAVRVFAGGAWR